MTQIPPHALTSGLIRLSRHDAVLQLTLARPDQRNAMTPEMLIDLRTAITNIPHDVRALVLDGEGKVFCAGFDLERSQGQSGIAVVQALLTELSAIVSTLRTLPIPVVIAVQGAAIAGGCALITAADAVITHPEAQFGYPAPRLGLSPAVSAPTLSEQIGMGATRALQLDGGLISGTRALEIGLVTHVVDREAVSTTCLSVVLALAAKPTPSLAATRTLLTELYPQANADSGLPHASLAASMAGAGTPEQLFLLAQAWNNHLSKSDQSSR